MRKSPLRTSSLIVLLLISAGVSLPAYGQANEHGNNYYSSDGLANGWMWTEISEIGEKQARFFKSGFVNGIVSGRASAVFDIGSLDLDQETVKQLISVISGESDTTVGEYSKLIDNFYSDSNNLDIPVAVAISCIKLHREGNMSGYRTVISKSREAYRRNK